MANDLILITGATGHLGFRVLRHALEAGYSVRAAVRSQSKADAIRTNPALTAKEKKSPLSFAIIPDIEASGAYDEAVKDVKYIIHVASPLSTTAGTEYEKNIIQPAIRGTLNMLEAAYKSPSVERVVITSSVVAITPVEAFVEGTYSGGPINAQNRISESQGPFENGMAAYATSKVAALNRAETWMKDHKPHFDLIHIHPSYIEGRNDMSTTLEDFKNGTNRFMIELGTGVKTSTPRMITTNHVDDTAWVHVQSLRPSIRGNQSFLVTNSKGDGVEWNDVRDIVKRKFPEAVKKGILSTEGEVPSFAFPYDAKKTEETFGFKFAGFESQVVSVLEHYLEVYEREKGGK